MADASTILASTPGSVAAVTLENAGSGSLAGGITTFGQVFAAGQLPSGGTLYALIGGQTYAVQVDVKTTWPDGSAKMAVITMDRPPLAAGAEQVAVLVASTVPEGPSVDLVQGLAGHSFVVTLTPAGQATMQFDVLKALQDAVANGTASFWQEGPLASQARVEILIPNGSQRLVFDVTAYKDGSFAVEAQFNNDRAMEAIGGRAQYSMTAVMDGKLVASKTLDQGQYQNWHESFTSNANNGVQGLGSPSTGWLNIVHDVAKLGALGVVPDYDLSLTIPETTLSYFASAIARDDWGDPLSNNDVTQYMPMTGGRGDIGFTTAANASWLISGDARAAAYALGQAEAASGIPWNFYDAAHDTWLNTDNYARLWTDARGGTGTAGDPRSTGLTQQPDALTGWTPDSAHQPNLSFVPYVMTGQRWMLDNLEAQASFSIMSYWPYARSNDQDLLAGPITQVRGAAWALRAVEDAAWAAPAGSTEQAYFRAAADANWAWLVSKIPEWTTMQGEAHGWVPGAYGTAGALPPWQQDFFASTTILAASRGNADALTFLNWQKNFLIGRFEHAADGFNLHDGAAYIIAISDTGTGRIYTTWSEIGAQTVARNWSNGDGWTNSQGYFGQLALASLAGIYVLTGDTEALDAYKRVAAANPFATTASDFAKLASYAVTVPGIYGGWDGTIVSNPMDQSGTSSGTSGTDTAAGTDDLVTLTQTVSGTVFDLGSGSDKIVLADGTNLLTTRSVETVIGGTGNDTVVIGTMDQPVRVDLGAGTDALQLPDGGTNQVTATNVERITGGSGNDRVTLGAPLTGGAIDLAGGSDELILASGGPNAVTVRNTETITGGNGDDTVTLLGTLPTGMRVDLGAGKDKLILPASGSNRVIIANVETVVGGSGTDTVVQGGTKAGTTVLESVELYLGNATDETIIYAAPVQGATADLASGTDTVILSGDGPNRFGVSGAEVLRSGAGDDVITFIGPGVPAQVDLGGGADKLILAGPGNNVTVTNVETVLGGAGDDGVVFGAPLRDALVDLGAGTDSVVLSSKGANVVAIRNVESITGGTRNDIITILTSTDSSGKLMPTGQEAAPLLIKVQDIDRITGSAMNEEVHFQTSVSNAIVNLAGGTDKVVLHSDQGNALTVRKVEVVVGSDGADNVVVASVAPKGIALDLGAGADKVVLAAAAGTGLHAQVANVETILGGVDNETVAFTAPSGAAVVDLGAGVDRLELGNFNNVVAVANVETVIGNAGADRVRVTGGSGSFLDGAGGNDTLTGGAGADTLKGGTGIDVMTGGAGADRFLFTAIADSPAGARDTILDLTLGEDQLAFQGMLQGSFAWLGTGGFTAGGHTEARYLPGTQVMQIDVNGDGTGDMAIQLNGVEMSNITASVFLWL